MGRLDRLATPRTSDGPGVVYRAPVAVDKAPPASADGQRVGEGGIPLRFDQADHASSIRSFCPTERRVNSSSDSTVSARRMIPCKIISIPWAS